MDIRDARPSDLPEIDALERRCFSYPRTAETLLNQIRDEGHVFLVAACDGALAAYGSFQYVLDEGYIVNVATDPAFRRRGAASALLSALIARGRARDLAFLTLEVRESNAPARGLYAGHGFLDVARRPRYYEDPAEDAILMTLYLK